MEPAVAVCPPSLARSLILEELFDLSLYRAYRRRATGDLASLLDALIEVEERHHRFWQEFFGFRVERLGLRRSVKLCALSLLGRLFGPSAVHLVLEAIEVHGVRKYLSVWRLYRETPLGRAVGTVLEDEFRHEDEIVSRLAARKIRPERIRNVFLGFNDGLVEILGAVSGFHAAFDDAFSVLAAGASVAVAGAISMAAGAYASLDSENEVRRVAQGKEEFLGRPVEADGGRDSPGGAAATVGACYFVGALVPILPVLLGAESVWISVASAGTAILLVSILLAFLSGMDVRRRIGLNLLTIAVAVGVTYGIGTLARRFLGEGG